MKQVPPFKNKTFIQSLCVALEGLKVAYLDERNLRFHVKTTIVIMAISLICRLTISEYLWVFLSIFMVILSELLNTVVENVVDLITDQYHPLAKKVKDIAAGMVLLAACFALIVGISIFIPKMLLWLR